MSVQITIFDSSNLESCSRNLTPKLLQCRKKGESGIIGVLGGSHDNCGALYFTGMAALKTGADSVHIMSGIEAAANCIKTFSPNLQVHPFLDYKRYGFDRLKKWVKKVKLLVIGSGVDLELPYLMKDALKETVKICKTAHKPLILDGEAMIYLAQKRELLKDYPGIILTPNEEEYNQLFPNSKDPNQQIFEMFGSKCVVFKKGVTDEFYSADSIGFGPEGDSGRRCDGQGDFLAGTLATFYYWALQEPYDQERVFSACYAASKLTKDCNLSAFDKLGRSMVTTDMIDEIGKVFKENFEI